MKALSIREPWIGMIVDGTKTIETRTWPTNYRGPLLLVGSKKPRGKYAGLAAATANLVDCRLMTVTDQKAAGCLWYWGAYAWVLEDVQKVPEPFKVRGQLRLYDVDYYGGKQKP